MSWVNFEAFREAFRKRLIPALLFTLLLSTIQVLLPPPSQATTASATSCSTFELGRSGGGVSVGGGMKILPLHGQSFYSDLKNGFNATYIGYRITNSSGGTIEDLWLEVDIASSASLTLVNPADAYQPIGRLTNGATKVIYVLVKALEVSATAQRHDVFIHKGYPNGNTSLLSPTSSCYYSFTRVSRSLSASSNKVSSISVSTTTPTIGDSVVVTVRGIPGQSGAGSSPDNDIMWLSGASSSNWPTRSLRLERTSIAIQFGQTANLIETVDDQLIITNVTDGYPTGSGGKKFTNKSRYTATFTFRVLGGSSTNPVVKPLALIASGTQLKYTGKYPSNTTTIATSDVILNMKAVKQVETITALSADTLLVSYRVTVTDTGTPMNLDYLVDDPDPGMLFDSGSAFIIDANRTTATQITNPFNQGSEADPKYIFPGPFVGRLVSGVYTVELTYRMQVPVNKSASERIYKNRAYGLVGPTLVGSTSSTISVGELSLAPNSGPATSRTIDEEKPRQDQVINFPQIPVLGVGQTYNLDGVASSGLAVSYTSTTPTSCTVSGDVLTVLSTELCTVTASQSGDSNWNPAIDVSRSFTPKQGQVITFNVSTPMAINATQTDSTTSTSGLLVTTEAISSDICVLIATNGSEITTTTGSSVTIRGKKSGACVVVATQAGNDTFAAATPVERTISIGTLQVIEFTIYPSPQNLTGDFTGSISARPLESNGSLVTEDLVIEFVSQTPNICTLGETVSFNSTTKVSTPTVTRVREGLCVITASQDGYVTTNLSTGSTSQSTKYAPAEDVTRSFTIGSKTPAVSVMPTSSIVQSGESQTVSVWITLPTWSDRTPSLAGTVRLFVSGRVASNSTLQSTTISLATPTSGETLTSTFTVEAGQLSAGAPTELMYLTAEFVTSNDDFTSASTPEPVQVSVAAPSALTSLTLSSSSSSGFVGEEVCLATLVTDANGAPVIDILVQVVISGPNGPYTVNVLTDSSGYANFCYIGNAEGSDSVKFQINNFETTVAVVWSQRAPDISYSPSSITLNTNTQMASLTPTNTGGSATSWTISPLLPSGLNFNSSTGVISGTPTTAQSSTQYVITATNSSGSDTALVTITIIRTGGPTNISFTLNVAQLTKGAVVIITATASDPGRVAFYERGQVLKNCKRELTVALVATCTWRVKLHGNSSVGVVLTPTDSNFSSSSSQRPTLVARRVSRP